MDKESRLKLKEMVTKYNTEETTDKIRELKHSKNIREDVKKMINLKETHKRLKNDTMRKMCEKNCNFLYTNYTNIFNKLYKGDLDLVILDKFITILGQIEEGVVDQHEASVKVGSLLKELYIDSALREDKRREKMEKKNMKKVKKVSWNDFKTNMKYEDYRKLNIN